MTKDHKPVKTFAQKRQEKIDPDRLKISDESHGLKFVCTAIPEVKEFVEFSIVYFDGYEPETKEPVKYYASGKAMVSAARELLEDSTAGGILSDPILIEVEVVKSAKSKKMYPRVKTVDAEI